MSRITRALGALTLCALASFAGAQPGGWETGADGLKPVPALAARVTDLTNTLSASDRSALETKLSNWERESGNQFAVLLVPTTQPEPIETYSIRVAEAWKIGRKGRDNGVLLVVAKDDRKLRLEVGYGFEGVLTDATSRRIIAETITPLFRQGQFAAGINAGVDRVIGVIGKGQPLPPAEQRNQSRRSSGIGFETLLILLLVVVPIMGGILRRIF
ncbi:MAG TPA: TPM domain-containing protein, partial [Casimicrobiaceae bacterium]|nr:TPM domain-containing protein [Casimicrobiaceae bacterium]